MSLSVREIESRDLPLICGYWLNSSPDFLKGMGVDLNKIPSAKNLELMINGQLEQNYREKKSYCTIWEIDGKAIGHCNVGDIKYGYHAFMHLHIWEAVDRKRGCGIELAKMSLPYFFDHLKLKNLFCEPYALNPAPNRTLERLGFEFVQEYITVPGALNFMQPVKRWVLSRDKFEIMQERARLISS